MPVTLQAPDFFDRCRSVESGTGGGGILPFEDLADRSAVLPVGQVDFSRCGDLTTGLCAGLEFITLEDKNIGSF